MPCEHCEQYFKSLSDYDLVHYCQGVTDEMVKRGFAIRPPKAGVPPDELAELVAQSQALVQRVLSTSRGSR